MTKIPPARCVSSFIDPGDAAATVIQRHPQMTDILKPRTTEDFLYKAQSLRRLASQFDAQEARRRTLAMAKFWERKAQQAMRMMHPGDDAASRTS
jgi:hypothetical protein